MKKVLVFGTFDGLHEGHLNFFKQAKEYGDFLVVVVARDSTVERVKKRKPKFNEQDRLKYLLTRSREWVSEARLGNEGDNPYKIIGEIKPDVICLGYDQTHFTEKLEEKIREMGLKIEIERLKPFHPEKFHSSLLNK